MKHTPQDNAFKNQGLATLEEIKNRIKTDDDLTPIRRRDMLSALNTVSRWFEVPLANLPAARKPLRERFDELTPASVGVSNGRFANVRSQLNRVLDYIHAPLVRNIQPISPEWKRLLEQVKTKGDRNSLSAFARFCSALLIIPEEVIEAVSSGYLLERETGCMVRKPKQKHQELCRAWNRLVERLAGKQNLAKLEVPKYADRYGLPRDRFPQSLREEIEQYRQYLTNGDVLAERATDKPLRPASADHRVKQIYRAASALVHRGTDIEHLTSLEVLTRVENVEQILRFYFERGGNKQTKMLSDMAEGLFKVAYRFLEVDAAHLDQLRAFKKKTKLKMQGMTAKNRHILRQFNDPETVRKLRNLPYSEFKRIDSALSQNFRTQKAKAVPNKLAMAYQFAIAIMILQNAPMRIKNLAGLHLERHLSWKVNRGRLVIVIPADEVKNEEELSFELPKADSAFVKRYIHVYRLALVKGQNGYLFPGENGNHKSENNLSQQLAKLTHEAIGVRLHGHLFRHVMGKIFLDINPGAYEVLRKVLGHRSMETTKNYYTGEETRSSLEFYQKSLRKKLDDFKPTDRGSNK